MSDKQDNTTETLLDLFLQEAKEIKVDKNVLRLIIDACLPIVAPGVTLTLKTAVSETRKVLEMSNVRVIGLEAIIERLILFFIHKGILDKGEIYQLQTEIIAILREELSHTYDVKETDLLMMLDIVMKSVKEGKIAPVEELAKLIHSKTFVQFDVEDLEEVLESLFERLAELGYLRSGD